MSTFPLITTILIVATLARGFVIPCPEEGCNNITIYLGPSWGSKTIYFPSLRDSEEPHLAQNSSQPKISIDESDLRSSVDAFPQQRPIPPNNQLTVDEEEHRNISDSNDFWVISETIRHPIANESREENRVETESGLDENEHRYMSGTARYPIHHSLHEDPFPHFSQSQNDATPTPPTDDPRTINLTGLGITGDEVKTTLSALSRNVKSLLRSLYLGNNNIRNLPVLTFPVELEYGLQELSLENCSLRYLDSFTRFELSRLWNLRNLSLARTNLVDLHNLYMPHLEVLDLSGNLLTSVPEAVQTMGYLKELYLDNNYIFSVDLDQLKSLEGLRVLSLAGNKLKDIQPDTFQSLRNLQVLHLNNNGLGVKLADKLSVPYYTIMYLGDNHLQCSCSLVEMVSQEWPLIADRDDLTCYNKHNEKMWVRYMKREDVYSGCPGRWDWVQGRTEKLHDLERWIKREVHMSNVYTVCWWLLAGVAAVAVVCVLRKYKRKSTKPTAPYNILDDKMVQA